MSGWVTVSVSDLSDKDPPRTDRGHHFQGIHGKFGFPQFCQYCGHVPLKNDISVLCTKIGCAYPRDPRFIAWRRR